ncbi:MAG: AAA family ATPase [Alphaproteobacteria bacterium]|nr:AAA family ATPase [Alphaproteobacteria bacterium]
MTPNAPLACQSLRPPPTLFGHQEALTLLRQAFYSHKMPPVWLLSGEKGIGKAALAYTISEEILSNGALEPALIKRQIAQGTYPNFLTIKKNPNSEGKIPRDINIEEARKIEHFLHQHAAIPGWRVVLIDAVDEMNRTAANSLLKILEDPPAQTLFFLVAHSLGQVLPTIRSRCCRLPLFPLSIEDLKSSLGDDIPLDVLHLAQGSIGKAMALQQADGLKLLDQIIQGIEGALKANWQTAQSLCTSLGKDSTGFDVLLNLILWTLYRIIILIHMGEPLTPQDKKLSPLLKLKALTHWIDTFQRASSFIKIAQNTYLDRNHIIMALFFIIENPMIGDEFIYGSF